MRAAAAAALLAVATAGFGGCASDGGPETTAITVTQTQRSSSGEGDTGFTGIPDLVDEVQPSVVAVALSNGEGSGVIWSADGIVVTNNHVVEGASRVEVVFANGSRAEGRVRATDPATDLAIVDVDATSLPEARFSNDLPRVGELAVALGNPLGFENTVTAGIVSGLHRAIPATGEDAQALVDLIQTDAAISPGNSGGALVNRDGEVIGINLAYIPPEAGAVAIGFAVPSSTVTDVVRQLLEDGEAEHAFLGVRPAELTPQVAERFGIETRRGVLVASVVEGSGAEDAGIEAGDVIVAVDGTPLRRVEDLLAVLRARAPGDRVTLTIARDGDEREVEVELSDRPE